MTWMCSATYVNMCIYLSIHMSRCGSFGWKQQYCRARKRARLHSKCFIIGNDVINFRLEVLFGLWHFFGEIYTICLVSFHTRLDRLPTENENMLKLVCFGCEHVYVCVCVEKPNHNVWPITNNAIVCGTWLHSNEKGRENYKIYEYFGTSKAAYLCI